MTAVYTLEQVKHCYGEITALDLDRLEIEAGRITALIGPNGAGKSSLLNLLSFVTKPTAGVVRFFGEAATDANLAERRRRVGWVAQKPYLLRGTVVENVELGLKFRGESGRERRRKALAMLEVLEIGRFAERPARSLSGGESQKVALARALVLEPEVLLFDEPFTHLDQGSAERIEELIVSYCRAKGRTVIFSTHDRLHGMAFADDRVTLFAGRRVSTPLINLFAGRVRDGRFETGRIEIFLPEDVRKGAHASLDPNEIVLSTAPLASSIRNSFRGRVVTIAEEAGRVRVAVEAGERFQAIITHQSLEELKLNLGSTVWVNFKATVVKVFS